MNNKRFDEISKEIIKSHMADIKRMHSIKLFTDHAGSAHYAMFYMVLNEYKGKTFKHLKDNLQRYLNESTGGAQSAFSFIKDIMEEQEDRLSC